MIHDDPSNDAKKDGESSGERPLPELAQPATSKPEITPSQPPIEPPAPIGKLSGDSGGEEKKLYEHCSKEISVSINRDWMERATFHISWITSIVVVCTFVVFYLQLRESKTQTKIFREQAAQVKCDAAKQLAVAKQALTDSEETFRHEQQPYVWLSGIPAFDVHKNPDSTSQVVVDLHFLNYGRSPAVSLRISTDVEIGSHAINKIHPKPLSVSKSLLPPTKEDFLSGVTPPFKTLPNLLIDEAVVIFSRFQYLDPLGHRYETDVCMSRLATGAWRYCQTHNEIKDCAKEACEN